MFGPSKDNEEKDFQFQILSHSPSFATKTIVESGAIDPKEGGLLVMLA